MPPRMARRLARLDRNHDGWVDGRRRRVSDAAADAARATRGRRSPSTSEPAHRRPPSSSRRSATAMILHLSEHVAVAPPSSHSSPVSTMPSPHAGSWQYVRHSSGASAFAEPSSQFSVTVFTPSPQIEFGFATTHTSSSVQPPNWRPGSEVERELRLQRVAEEERRQRHVVEPPLLVDVMRRARVAHVRGRVDPHLRAVRDDRRLIEVAVLDGEPAPVLQAHVGVRADVDRRHLQRPTCVLRRVVAVEHLREDLRARERGVRIGRGRSSACPTPTATRSARPAGRGAAPAGRERIAVSKSVQYSGFTWPV